MNKEEQQIIFQFLLSTAMRMANEEGIEDEQESIIRANAIVMDALGENGPQTDAGKQALERAKEIAAVQATQEALQPKKFDYDALSDKTAIPAVEAILKKLGEHSAFLPVPTHPSKEYEKNCEQAYEKLTLDTFKALNANDVGMTKYKYVFDSLKGIISALEDHVMQQVTGHRHEILSRLFGTKNPGTEKFDSSYATYEALLATLEKVRTDTGGEMSDYFNIENKGDDK